MRIFFKTYLLLFILLLAFTFANAQENSKFVFNLKAKLQKTTVDTTKINILNKITSYYFYTNPKEGLQYSETALELATKIKWNKGIASTQDHIGICEWQLLDYNKAITIFYKSLLIYKDLKDKKGISEAYNNLGLLHIEVKKYDTALSYFSKSYKINKEINNKILLIYNLNNIALTYYKQKNYNKALEYYTKAKELNLSMSDKNGLGYSYSKIGKTYIAVKKYSKSLENLQKSLDNYDKNQSFNIGDTQKEISDTFYNMALENPSQKKIFLEKATKYLNSAIQSFRKAGNAERINSCYLAFYKIYKEQRNFSLALNNFEKYNTLNDSLFSNESKNKLANLQTKREIELRDKQIEIQKLKINSDTKKVYLLVTITLLIALFFIIFLYLYVSKRNSNKLLVEKNKEISNINQQKDKFFSIIAHDLRGPFSGFLGITELLAEEITILDKEEIQFSAVNMRSSAHSLSRLLDNLLEWSKMEQGILPFSPKKYNLLKITKDCMATQIDAINKKDIQIEIVIDKSKEIYADKHILQSAIRNILSNAVKFTPKEGIIKIESKEDPNSTIISIADTGIGMDAKMIENIFKLDIKTNRKGTEDEPSSGLGLILCKEFIEKHGGKIWVESKVNIGSTFYFNIPHLKT